jgi:hypothetical protein
MYRRVGVSAYRRRRFGGKLLALPALLALLALLLAEVAKLADAPDLGSGGAILRGSSPLLGISSLQQGAYACTLERRLRLENALPIEGLAQSEKKKLVILPSRNFLAVR